MSHFWTVQQPLPALQQLFDPFFQKGEFLHYWKAIYLDRLTDDAIEAIVVGSASRPSQRSLLAIWALGGAMSRVGTDETPLGNRSAPFLLEMIGTWSEAAQTEQNVVWVRHVFETMHSFSSGKINPNFSGAGEDRAFRSCGSASLPASGKVKQAYDPTNMFRLSRTSASLPLTRSL
jgi:hypothetical protein